MEHRAAITRREILRQLLELVPQHRVGTRESVDREVALEHTARRSEVVDQVKVPIPGCRKQLVGRGRLFPLVPTVAVYHHLDSLFVAISGLLLWRPPRAQCIFLVPLSREAPRPD